MGHLGHGGRSFAAGDRTVCIGCGAVIRDITGPTHRTMGASPGCWAAFCDVLDMEFSDFRHPDCHRLTMDAYASQHPGSPSRQSIQSVGGHLISLHLMLERGLDGTTATRALRRAITRSSLFSWLPPPSSLGSTTIVDVRSARDLREHQTLVRGWAESVWAAWSVHHEAVRAWAVLP